MKIGRLILIFQVLFNLISPQPILVRFVYIFLIKVNWCIKYMLWFNAKSILIIIIHRNQGSCAEHQFVGVLVLGVLIWLTTCLRQMTPIIISRNLTLTFKGQLLKHTSWLKDYLWMRYPLTTRKYLSKVLWKFQKK